MAMQMKVQVPGGEMTIQGTDMKEIFRKAAFWQALPTVCPIDGQPTRLEFRSPQDYEYYMVVTTGPFPYEYKLGIHNNEARTLFTKDQWTYYDPESKKEVVVWERGNLHKDRIPSEGLRGRPSPSTTTDPDPQDYQPQGNAGSGRSQDAESNAKLQKARAWVVKKLNDAGVSDSLRGAVLTSMLGHPVQNDINRMSKQDILAFREYLSNIPDGVERALEDVKAEDPAAAAADGSDLDESFPDFLD